MLSKCANYMPMLILMLMATLALAQSDPEKFAEGRVALDTHKDCPAAYRALSGVSDNGRKDAMWIYYMGKTTECLKKYGDALSYYRAYSKLIPPNAELLNKIGELQYEAHKEAEEQKNADDLAAQKSDAQALAAKQLSDEREAAAKTIEEAADQKKAAQGRLPQTLSRLQALMHVESGQSFKIDGCSIFFDNGKQGGRFKYTIPLARIRVAERDQNVIRFFSQSIGDFTSYSKGIAYPVSGVTIRLEPAPSKEEGDEILMLLTEGALACSGG